jgi:large subunit ribosomal protein L15
MKLHELRPAAGSRTARTRVGRGIAAGKGKTAGRGTKGQKARAGASIPPWFEGGQTPLHQRIPKLRGFRNPFKLEYEVVNLERISALVELGALEAGDLPGRAPKPGSKAAPVTVNQEILKSVGLVRSLDKPLKVLGQGEVTRPLFVVADAFSKSAASKIEAAGGTVSVIEMPKPGGQRRPREAAQGAAPDAAAGAAATDAAVEERPTKAQAPGTGARRRASGTEEAHPRDRAPRATIDERAGEHAEASAEPVGTSAQPAEAPAEPAGTSAEPAATEPAAEAGSAAPQKSPPRGSRAARGRVSRGGSSEPESGEPESGEPAPRAESTGSADATDEPATESQPSGDA